MPSNDSTVVLISLAPNIAVQAETTAELTVVNRLRALMTALFAAGRLSNYKLRRH